MHALTQRYNGYRYCWRIAHNARRGPIYRALVWGGTIATGFASATTDTSDTNNTTDTNLISNALERTARALSPGGSAQRCDGGDGYSPDHLAVSGELAETRPTRIA